MVLLQKKMNDPFRAEKLKSFCYQSFRYPGFHPCYKIQVIKFYSIDRFVDLALGPKARSIPAQGIALGRRKPMKNHILPSLLSQTPDQGSGVWDSRESGRGRSVCPYSPGFHPGLFEPGLQPVNPKPWHVMIYVKKKMCSITRPLAWAKKSRALGPKSQQT